ncbi:MAG: hypothetical protein ISQ86_11170 [Alphaproteobacteria bacterium]|nr:hypothetical protein [Alphaproteobacteria bacterium]
MRALVGSAVLASAILIPTALFAADTPGRPNEIVYTNVAGPAEVPNAPNGDDTIVCNYERETGTLFEERVCRTLRAWKMMQADSREFMEFQHLGSHQAGEGG